MSESAQKEEHVFNVFWKIKNFSYAFEVIDSPEFNVAGAVWYLSVKPRDIECRLVSLLHSDERFPLEYSLSFIPCDDSLPLSATGSLKVSKETLFRSRRKSFLPGDTLTIQFRFQNNFCSSNSFVQSQIGVRRKCLIWTLKDLDQEQDHETDIMTTKSSDMYGSIVFCLKCTEGINSDEQFYIEISRKNGEQCCCVLKICVLDPGAEVVKSVSDEFIFTKDGPINWKFPPIIKKSELVRRDGLLNLFLKCDVAISLGKVTDVTEVLGCFEDVTLLPDDWKEHLKLFKKEPTPVFVSDLQRDMKNILDDKMFCDASLQVFKASSENSEVFHVHKAILSGRSPVFKSLFMKDLTRNIDSNIVLEKLIDADIIRQLLCYIYTDTINNYEMSNIKNLYAAANAYQVPSLKQSCSAFLMANLSVSDFGDIFALADIFADKNLAESVIGFISRNHSEILASKEWKEFEEENADLALTALKTICSKKLFQ